MKTPIKALILTTASLVVLLLAAWTGTFLYWHFRIKSALVSLQDRSVAEVYATGSLSEGLILSSNPVLEAAGCRAVPYLVRAVAETKDEELYEELMENIIGCLAGPPPYGRETTGMIQSRIGLWCFSSRDWKARREDFLNWWRENGDRHHSWWRVWSSSCQAAR